MDALAAGDANKALSFATPSWKKNTQDLVFLTDAALQAALADTPITDIQVGGTGYQSYTGHATIFPVCYRLGGTLVETEHGLVKTSSGYSIMDVAGSVRVTGLPPLPGYLLNGVPLPLESAVTSYGTYEVALFPGRYELTNSNPIFDVDINFVRTGSEHRDGSGEINIKPGAVQLSETGLETIRHAAQQTMVDCLEEWSHGQSRWTYDFQECDFLTNSGYERELEAGGTWSPISELSALSVATFEFDDRGRLNNSNPLDVKIALSSTYRDRPSSAVASITSITVKFDDAGGISVYLEG